MVGPDQKIFTAAGPAAGDAVSHGEAATLVRALRAAEGADPGCERFPRFGASDDATVVYAPL
jgi:hypothetical protein